MKKLIFTMAILSILITSCNMGGNSGESTTTDSTSTQVDSTVIDTTVVDTVQH
jgi:hypothetical protein